MKTIENALLPHIGKEHLFKTLIVYFSVQLMCCIRELSH